MRRHVTFFPAWHADPYLPDLGRALADEGWTWNSVGPRGLVTALAAAIAGRRIIHLHWYEGFSPARSRANGLAAWLFLPFLWMAGRRGRLVWTVHNLVPHDGYAPLVGVPFLRGLARASSHIITHFEPTAAAAGKLLRTPHKIRVIPPAGYGHVLGPPVPRERARELAWPGLGPENTLFVQPGSLRRYKHPARTVAAFRAGAPDTARLVVAGRCPDDAVRAETIAAAGDDSRIRLRFEHVPDAELAALLCAADWAICPYTAIDNPGALNLALAYGAPVIAPALPVVRAITAGCPVLLYGADDGGPPSLAAAVAAAATLGTPPVAGEPRPGISRRRQAQATAELYRDARPARR